jgi:hypothetical protein
MPPVTFLHGRGVDEISCLLSLAEEERHYRNALVVDLWNMPLPQLLKMMDETRENPSDKQWFVEMLASVCKDKVNKFHADFLHTLDEQRRCLMTMVKDTSSDEFTGIVEIIERKTEGARADNLRLLENTSIESREELTKILSDRVEADRLFLVSFAREVREVTSFTTVSSPRAVTAPGDKSHTYYWSLSPTRSPSPLDGCLTLIATDNEDADTHYMTKKLNQREFEHFVASIVFDINDGRKRWPGLFEVINRNTSLRCELFLKRMFGGKFTKTNLFIEFEKNFVDAEKLSPILEMGKKHNTMTNKLPSQTTVHDWFSWA